VSAKELKGGRYTLLRKLGEGSQGETYEAMDHGAAGRGGRPRDASLADSWVRYVREQRTGGEVPKEAELVAIKCFRVGTAKSWKDVELAEREARTLASLHHPRLPRYFEHFEEDGALYLVMEKIEGESLATLRASAKDGASSRRAMSMSAADVTRMLEDIADALQYLHGRAPFAVHRDIKPGNILRRPDGSFALVDFGAVRDRLKPAGGSTVVGTFGFMAPEQFQGRASPKSDVYGLGATAIAMLTGAEPEDLPHEGLGIDVARALPRGTPEPLVRALTAMLVADPDRRAASADEVLALLREERRSDRKRERKSKSTSKSNRRERRASTKREVNDGRKERKRARAAARARRPPLLARLLGRLGLLVAWLVVWTAVGVAVPFVLVLLSLLFGGALRRAATACVHAARRSQAALGRASLWLSGHRQREDEEQEERRIRVASDPERVRAVTTEDLDDPVQEADAWMEERLEKEAQRERMRLHARAPGKRKFWGR
jgi:serine/threonine protein kinase